MAVKSRNPFANYTLSITTQYETTHTGINDAEKKPKLKKYTNMNDMLRECVFLGATFLGTNYIA